MSIMTLEKFIQNNFWKGEAIVPGMGRVLAYHNLDLSTEEAYMGKYSTHALITTTKTNGPTLVSRSEEVTFKCKQ